MFARGIRFVAAIALLVAVIFIAAVIVGMGEFPRLAGSLVALLVVLAGFLGLGITRTKQTPWLPARFALVYGALLSMLFLVAFMRMPGPRDAVTAPYWLTGFVLSVFAAVLMTRKPAIARMLLVVLFVGGALACLRFIQRVALVSPELLGPSQSLAAVVGASVGPAWLSAVWHARSLWASAPIRAVASATTPSERAS